jgi:hypothetical protein
MESIAVVTNTDFIFGKSFVTFQQRKANLNSSGFGNKNNA